MALCRALGSAPEVLAAEVRAPALAALEPAARPAPPRGSRRWALGVLGSVAMVRAPAERAGEACGSSTVADTESATTEDGVATAPVTPSEEDASAT